MLFRPARRFSGTPIDLLSVKMGGCAYERGADGRIMHTLTSPPVVSVDAIAPG